MSEDAPTKSAGQPFTFGGVGRFASARLPRLLAVAALMAALSGMTLAWFVARCWAPVLQEATEKLPEGGAIQGGRLAWPSREMFETVGNSFLGIRVDPSNSQEGPRSADLWIEFRLESLRLRSLLGWVEFPYPTGWLLSLGKSEIVPRWGAWKNPGLALVAIGGIPGFILTWGFLALPLCLVPRIIAIVFGLDLSFAAAWKLAVAAHLPGALLMCFAIVLYGLGQIGLVLFTVLTGAHFLLTWVYLIGSPLTLGRKSKASRRENPFRAGDDE